jgi:hypothetical protein
MPLVEETGQVATVPGIDRANGGLDIRARRRLALPHPGRCERLGPTRDVLEPHHRSVAEGGDLVVHLCLDLHPAALSAPVVAQPHGHAVTGVDELLWIEPQLLEGLVEPLPEADDRPWANAGVGSLVRGQHPLDLGVEMLDRGVEVTAVVGLYEVARPVDVLLRHRPPR